MGLRLCDRGSSDVYEVHRIVQECYPNDPYDHADVEKMLQKYPTWFIDEAGIQACLISEVSKGQPYIWSVCTRESHRGRGYASVLIKEFEKHYAAAGYVRPWLHVRVENPAQRLYFALGYRVSSFEPNLYGVREHGLTMRHNLELK